MPFPKCCRRKSERRLRKGERKIWVGHSKFWVIPGTEDIPFVKTWKAVLTKRGLAMLAWAVIAAVVAGLVILIF